MKGKPKGGVTGKVSSSTLAYPGNSFKYSPKFPTDTPQQKLNVFDVSISTTLESVAANTASSVVSNRQESGSVVLSSAEHPPNKLSKVDLDTGPHQRQRGPPFQNCDEDDTVGYGGQNQEEVLTEKVIVEVLQKVERDIQEMEHSFKKHAKEVKNGPKKCKN